MKGEEEDVEAEEEEEEEKGKMIILATTSSPKPLLSDNKTKIKKTCIQSKKHETFTGQTFLAH